MPTLLQLRLEPWWDREIITPELDWCGDELCRRTGAPPWSIGTKGDENHLNGGHRSQEWIVNSDWCTNIHYTVQNGLSGEQPRHIAALDRTPLAWGTPENRAQMVVETNRLLAAARSGRLPGITQIQGTLDGRTTYGQNFPSLITTVPSDSHLDHWHLTFDRRYLRDAALMARIVDVVLGEEDDMFNDADRGALGAIYNAIVAMRDGTVEHQVPAYAGGMPVLATQVDELHARPPVQPAPVDEEAIRKIVREELDKTRLTN